MWMPSGWEKLQNRKQTVMQCVLGKIQPKWPHKNKTRTEITDSSLFFKLLFLLQYHKDTKRKPKQKTCWFSHRHRTQMMKAALCNYYTQFGLVFCCRVTLRGVRAETTNICWTVSLLTAKSSLAKQFCMEIEKSHY